MVCVPSKTRIIKQQVVLRFKKMMKMKKKKTKSLFIFIVGKTKTIGSSDSLFGYRLEKADTFLVETFLNQLLVSLEILSRHLLFSSSNEQTIASTRSLFCDDHPIFKDTAVHPENVNDIR